MEVNFLGSKQLNLSLMRSENKPKVREVEIQFFFYDIYNFLTKYKVRIMIK